MSFTVPELPYPKNALEPRISTETLEFHYEKHHKGYVAKLNGLVKDTPDQNKTLEELIIGSTGGLYNNAAQAWNHTFYWQSMTPKGGEPGEAVKAVLTRDFGGVAEFRKAFYEAAIGHFGSGWAWLVQTKEGKLVVVSTHDAGCPIRDGLKPILVCDVWEHAYYIDYRNMRATYVERFLDLINWEFVGRNIAH